MRLALICDDYLPNSTRVSAKMMHELACELLRQGHDPIVLCPNGGESKKVIPLCLDGITIYRFPNGRTKDTTKLKRAFNESLLSFNAWLFLSKEIKNKEIEGVIYYSPSIFFGPLVKKIKNIWHCKSYLILRDSFPQWLIDQGMIRSGGIVDKYFRYFERLNYNAADYIGVMSDKNKELFLAQYPHIANVNVLYNWTDAKDNSPQQNSDILKLHSLEEKIIFFYGGNIGHAQDMANLMRLAFGMRKHMNVHFLFIGQGDEVELVKKFIDEHRLDNCTYLPSISQDEYSALLRLVHVGLFSLARNHSVHNFPGKLLGYMANNLPILGSVNEGNDLMPIVSDAQAGYVHINGDDQQLLDSGVKLASDLQLRKKMGENGRSLLLSKFSVESAVDNIIRKLQ
ncbi:glycosyltransferase family 4 protein [Intestinirhabdus alba]|jgi:glycosyltransferase involved in cell wall biosynthesis|uniref:Glycosyltransferase n=1 Tax=Intestinirhabdus alba TaxID=2899544 RepID=A0A6L6IMF1_9ENTR|nr:glycosyltransferase family 4 protein [Intestinirhabdus alba]MTH47365.1 glycosyltransferase [Intestinirhabdus alba]